MSLSSSSSRFALLAVGVWVSFLVFGFTQEHLTRHEYGPKKERFLHTQALVAASSLGNVIVAAIAIMRSPGKSSKKWTAGVGLKDWLVVAVAYFAAHSFGLASLKYIIFPLQVVIKSCKAIPVMIGEILFAKVKPSLAKFVGVIMLCVGVALFTLSSEPDSGKHKASSGVGASFGVSTLVYGAALAVAALIGDAIYGPYQNKIVAKHKPSSWVLMFNMNFYELILAVAIDVLTSTELQEAWVFLERHPVEFGYRVLLFCASMSLGNVFIYKIQREFGALAVTKTTTVRKLVSLVLSVLWFGHSLQIAHYIAMAIVFAAPVVEQRIHKWEKDKSMKGLKSK
jgi:UDP-galactose transporter B1